MGFTVLGCGSTSSERRLPPVTEGLRAYYHLDGDARNIATDALHGDLVGPRPGVDRKGSRGALCFDGDDYVVLPASLLDGMPAGTVTAWVQIHEAGRQHTLLGKTQLGVEDYFQLLVDDDDRLRLDLGFNQQAILPGRTRLTPDQWYFVAATWDGATWQILIDASPDVASERVAQVPSVDREVLMGATDRQLAYLDGCLDEVGIYNRVLTVDELVLLRDS